MINNHIPYTDLYDLSRSLPDNMPVKEHLVNNTELMLELIEHLAHTLDKDPLVIEDELKATLSDYFTGQEQDAALDDFEKYLHGVNFEHTDKLITSLENILKFQHEHNHTIKE